MGCKESDMTEHLTLSLIYIHYILYIYIHMYFMSLCLLCWVPAHGDQLRTRRAGSLSPSGLLFLSLS